MSLQAFRWAALPQMHSCGMQSVTWVSQGISDAAQLTISITDEGVDQLAPPSSSTTDSTTPSSTVTGNTQISANPTQTKTGSSRRSADKRQVFDNWNGYGDTWLPRINNDLVENLDPTSQNWTWPSVNVTQGWYVLTATVPSFAISETSAPFFVGNGTSTFPCLAASSPSSTSPTLAPTSASSTTAASSTPTSANDTGSGGASSSSSHSNAGAIAGGVVGGVAFIAAVIAALFFYLCRRKRNLRARSAVGPGVPPKSKRCGERSESMQALPTRGHGSHSSSLASVAAAGPVSEEGLTMRENYVAGVLQTPAPPVSRRFSTQSAMGYKPSAPYDGYNMAPLRSTSQPGATRDAPSALTIPSSDEMLSGSAPASAARRKPVPKYDAEEFGDADVSTSTESSAPSTSTDAAHYKRHSFGMKPMQHVIQPDLPADRQA